MVELYANDFSSTLSAAIVSTSATSCTVTDATGAPSGGYFRCRLDAEIIGVSANVVIGGGPGATFTIERGIEETTPATHVNGTAIRQILTRESVREVLAPIGFPRLKPPVLTDFAWVNQGGATVDDDGRSLFLSAPAAAGISMRILKQTLPAAPYLVTACFMSQRMTVNYPTSGLTWRQSSDGKLVPVAYDTEDGFSRVYVYKFSNPNTSVTPYLAAVGMCGYERGLWMQLEDDGANRIARVSIDGIDGHYIELHTVGNTDYLTADEVGFFADARNATWPSATKLLHWDVQS